MIYHLGCRVGGVYMIQSFEKEKKEEKEGAKTAEFADYINEKISFCDLMLLLLNDLDEYDEGVIGDQLW